jgi:uncharacterized protein DUF6968
VIATRRLNVLGGARRPVTIRIGRPRRVRVGEWACPVQFAGGGATHHIAGRGVDSCQALVEALAGIHYTLAQSGSRFSWSSIKDETGFPRAVPYSFGPKFSARVNQHIDREVERFIQAAKRRLKRKAAGRRTARPSNKPLERTGYAGRSTPGRSAATMTEPGR